MIKYMLLLGLVWIAVNVAKAIMAIPEVIVSLICG